eukprot:Rhum_TRINITY_DN24085_c0_g1::Rhum_TRINITY_DN24085_c0_g1_i1::g.179260::m.179260
MTAKVKAAGAANGAGPAGGAGKDVKKGAAQRVVMAYGKSVEAQMLKTVNATQNMKLTALPTAVMHAVAAAQFEFLSAEEKQEWRTAAYAKGGSAAKTDDAED